MMRTILTSIFALSLITFASAQGGKPKVATVDMQKVYSDYFKTIQALQEISIEQAKNNKESNEKLTNLRELQSAKELISKQLADPALSDQKKQELFKEQQMKHAEAVQLENDRREFVMRKEQILLEKKRQRMQGILEEIRKTVELRAKSDDFDYVFDKSGLSTSQVPFLLYAKEATDVTAELLKELNKDAPPEFEKPE